MVGLTQMITRLSWILNWSETDVHDRVLQQNIKHKISKKEGVK